MLIKLHDAYCFIVVFINFFLVVDNVEMIFTTKETCPTRENGCEQFKDKTGYHGRPPRFFFGYGIRKCDRSKRYAQSIAEMSLLVKEIFSLKLLYG